MKTNTTRLSWPTDSKWNSFLLWSVEKPEARCVRESVRVWCGEFQCICPGANKVNKKLGSRNDDVTFKDTQVLRYARRTEIIIERVGKRKLTGCPAVYHNFHVFQLDALSSHGSKLQTTSRFLLFQSKGIDTMRDVFLHFIFLRL